MNWVKNEFYYFSFFFTCNQTSFCAIYLLYLLYLELYLTKNYKILILWKYAIRRIKQNSIWLCFLIVDKYINYQKMLNSLKINLGVIKKNGRNIIYKNKK